MSTEPTDTPDAGPAKPAGLTEVAIEAETEAAPAQEAAAQPEAPVAEPAAEPALTESAPDEDAGASNSDAEAAAEADDGAEPVDGDVAVEAAAPDEAPEVAAEAEPEPEADPEPDEALIARVRSMFAVATAAADDADAEPSSDADEAETAPQAIRFARWARPIAPRVYGVESQGADTLMTGFRRAAEAANAPYAVEDEKFGANVLVFVCSEWLELKATPKLEQLVPQLDHLIGHLRISDESTWRMVGFDETGAIDFAVVLIRVDDVIGGLSGETVALEQAVRIMLHWSDDAFASEKPLKVTESGRASLKPFTEAVLASAYDEGSPIASDDDALIEAIARGVAKRMASSGGSNGRGDPRRSNRRRRRGGGNSGGRRKRGGDSGAEA